MATNSGPSEGQHAPCFAELLLNKDGMEVRRGGLAMMEKSPGAPPVIDDSGTTATGLGSDSRADRPQAAVPPYMHIHTNARSPNTGIAAEYMHTRTEYKTTPPLETVHRHLESTIS